MLSVHIHYVVLAFLLTKLAFLWASMRMTTPMQVVMLLLLALDAALVTMFKEAYLIALVDSFAQVG